MDMVEPALNTIKQELDVARMRSRKKYRIRYPDPASLVWLPPPERVRLRAGVKTDVAMTAIRKRIHDDAPPRVSPGLSGDTYWWERYMGEWADDCGPIFELFDSPEVGGRFYSLIYHMIDLRKAYNGVMLSNTDAVNAAFADLAIAYILEVCARMPKHSERDRPESQLPQTINIGQLNIADVVSNVHSQIAAIARAHTSDERIPEALQALTDAITSDAALDKARRIHLLDNVADIAEAVEQPDKPRAISRAKAALTAIGTAASVSEELANAWQAWSHVLARLF
jgi:hypothetical protein